MAFKYQRPSIPYQPLTSLAHASYFESLTQENKPVPANSLDGEFNSIVDILNKQDEEIQRTAAGVVPGATDPTNASKVLIANGSAEIPLAWSFIGDGQVQANSLDISKMKSGARGSVVCVNNLGVVGPLAGIAGNVLQFNGDQTPSPVMPKTLFANWTVANTILRSDGTDVVFGKVMAADIVPGAITGDRIAAGTIMSDNLADNSVSGPKIAAGAVTGDKIAAGAVVSAKISSEGGAVGQVLTAAANNTTAWALPKTLFPNWNTANTILRNDGTNVVFGKVMAADIVPGAITGDRIAAGAVTGDKIAAGAVTGDKIAAGAVVSAKISSEGGAVGQVLTAAANNTTAWSDVSKMELFAWMRIQNGNKIAGGGGALGIAYSAVPPLSDVAHSANKGTLNYTLPPGKTAWVVITGQGIGANIKAWGPPFVDNDGKTLLFPYNNGQGVLYFYNNLVSTVTTNFIIRVFMY